MASSGQYPPRAEAALINAVNACYDVAITDPVGYFTTSATLASLQGKVTDFVSKYDICQNATTRTRPAIDAKNVSKRDLLDFYQPMVRQMTNMSGMTNPKRLELGFPPRAETASPVVAPGVAPAWELVGMNGWTAKFRVRPFGSEGRSTKAPGAIQLHVYSAIGAAAPTNPNDWKFEGSPSRANFEIDFDSGLAVGTRVWATFCWATARGLTSPACSPIPLLIGGGLPDAIPG
jgi:hypothetical protein